MNLKSFSSIDLYLSFLIYKTDRSVAILEFNRPKCCGSEFAEDKMSDIFAWWDSGCCFSRGRERRHLKPSVRSPNPLMNHLLYPTWIWPRNNVKLNRLEPLQFLAKKKEQKSPSVSCSIERDRGVEERGMIFFFSRYCPPWKSRVTKNPFSTSSYLSRRSRKGTLPCCISIAVAIQSTRPSKWGWLHRLSTTGSFQLKFLPFVVYIELCDLFSGYKKEVCSWSKMVVLSHGYGPWGPTLDPAHHDGCRTMHVQCNG